MRRMMRKAIRKYQMVKWAFFKPGFLPPLSEESLNRRRSLRFGGCFCSRFILRFSENALEDDPEVLEVFLTVKGLLQFLPAETPLNLPILGEMGLEVSSLLPDLHRIPLNDGIGLFSREALSCQQKQHGLRIDESSQLLQVGFHRFGINNEFFHHRRESVEDVIDKDGGIGCNDPFHGGMADVTFVPERDVFEGCEAIGPYQAGQTA